MGIKIPSKADYKSVAGKSMEPVGMTVSGNCHMCGCANCSNCGSNCR